MVAPSDESLPTATFDDFYGVVLNHVFSGPLRWSPMHQGWLRLRDMFPGVQWADVPADGDRVDPDEHMAALGAIDTFLESGSCSRCRSVTRAESHFVALNVLGDPKVYCVQQPSHEIVGSRGGEGTKKHLGGPDGCPFVKPALVYAPVWQVGKFELVGGFVYGEPLLADEVMLRTWCIRCVTVARRVHDREPLSLEVEAHELSVRDFTRVVNRRL